MMKKLFCLVVLFAFLMAVGVASIAEAQNLLFNGDLESTPADVYYDGFDPSVADDVPGWNLFLGAADGSYVYINGVGGGNTDVDMAPGADGGGLETAPLSRPAVLAGTAYKATVTYDYYFGPNGAAYFIDWYDGGGAYLSSDGGPLGDPNGPFGYDPYGQLFSIGGTAPGSAATAGVRFTSGSGAYAGLAADNFRLFVPEPTSFVLVVLASLGLLAVARRGRP